MVAPAPLTGWTLKEAMRSKAIYAITLSTMLGTFIYAAILPQVVTHLTETPGSRSGSRR